MSDVLTIAGQSIKPGKAKRIDLQVARLPTNTMVNIPIQVYRSKLPGPTLLVLAGMHGDELNGVETLRRMIVEDRYHPLHGTLILVPVLNVFGFIHHDRMVPDGRDLNRSFPGKRTGSLASRIAYAFMTEVVSKADYIIDLHTGGASRSNFPQVRCDTSNETLMQLATAFAPPLIVHSKTLAGSLRKAVQKLKIPMILFEGGETHRFDEESITAAMEGIGRVLYTLGMIESCAAATRSEIVIKRRWIRARRSGLFQPKVALGQWVEERSVLGQITDPYGRLKITVRAPFTGYVIGRNNRPIVNQGDGLLHIGA